MTSAKDVAQLVNGRIKQVDQLTINASFAPLADGQQQLGSLLMPTVQSARTATTTTSSGRPNAKHVLRVDI